MYISRNLCFAHCEIYLCHFQFISSALQHIYSGSSTNHILFLKTSVNLRVPNLAPKDKDTNARDLITTTKEATKYIERKG